MGDGYNPNMYGPPLQQQQPQHSAVNRTGAVYFMPHHVGDQSQQPQLQPAMHHHHQQQCIKSSSQKQQAGMHHMQPYQSMLMQQQQQPPQLPPQQGQVRQQHPTFQLNSMQQLQSAMPNTSQQPPPFMFVKQQGQPAQQQAYHGLPQQQHHQQQHQKQTGPMFTAPQQQQQQQQLSRYETPYRTIQSFFMNEGLRQQLLRKRELGMLSWDPSDPSYIHSVKHFHTLYPLESYEAAEQVSNVLGIKSEVFKATDSRTAELCALRRIQNVILQNVEFASALIEARKQIKHPNIVSVREFFQTNEFDKISIDTVFVYDYFPGAETLEYHYFVQTSRTPPESVLWSYICQIVSALKTIHSHNIACRTIHPSKILLTGKRRIRINCLGMVDVLAPLTNESLQDLQQQDFIALGNLILCLACKTPNAASNLSKFLDELNEMQQYSSELKEFVNFLLSLHQRNTPSNSNAPEHSASTNTQTALQQITQKIAHKMLEEMDYLHTQNDEYEEELTKELENGRLFRLLMKLNFILERSENEMSDKWSETGDRYVLKLFRDYVFHQTNENMKAVVDVAHVIECLNKLDAGSPEKMLLMGRDNQQTLLVVSYRDVKRLLNASFHELLKK